MELVPRISRLALILLGMGLTASAQIPHFLNPTRYDVPGASMAVVADVNGDGILDIVTANGYIPNLAGGGVSVLLGNGDGTFQPVRNIVAGGSPSMVVVGDFNHDGKADIAVANEPDPSQFSVPPFPGGPAINSVSILLGNGDGTFQPSIDTTTAGALALASADFNGDGNLDLVVATGQASSAQLLLGNGDGTFTVSNLPATAASGSVLTGDFNHDGIPDLIIFNLELLGNGDGTFRTAPLTLPGPNRYAFLGDFNGDGNLDLASVASGRSSTISEISFGAADGTFGQPFITNFSGGPRNAVAADFDGDGKADIFGAGRFPQAGLPPVGGLSLGQGDGTFNVIFDGFGFSLNQPGLTPFPAFAAAGDLDGNSSPDVVVATGFAVLVARNTSGHPALLAQVTVNVVAANGGTDQTGTVSLGGPAPAGGALVTLTSSTSSAFFPNGPSVLIPEGSQSANFTISTSIVNTFTPATITGTLNSVSQQATFNIVRPFGLTGISFSPSVLFGMFGGNKVIGTLTFSSPVSDGTVIKLSVNQPNSVLQAPTSVVITPGGTTGTFTMEAFPVSTLDTATVTASDQGALVSNTVAIVPETKTVVITKSEYVVSKSQLKVEATSTDAVALLQVFNASTGALLGTIPNVGNGKFVGQMVAAKPLTSIAVQSTIGGGATAVVPQK